MTGRALAVICGKSFGIVIYSHSTEDRTDIEAIMGTSSTIASFDRCYAIRDAGTDDEASQLYKWAIGQLLGKGKEVVMKTIEPRIESRVAISAEIDRWQG